MTSLKGALSPEIVADLMGRGDVRRFSRDAMLIVEGAVSSSLFVLLSGRLKVFSRDDRGREVIYNQVGPGEVFGEMILDGGPRSASVKALTEVECLEVRVSEIREFMRQCPEFAESLVCRLVERLRVSTAQSRSLALDSAFARTVASINELAVSDRQQALSEPEGWHLARYRKVSGLFFLVRCACAQRAFIPGAVGPRRPCSSVVRVARS